LRWWLNAFEEIERDDTIRRLAHHIEVVDCVA